MLSERWAALVCLLLAAAALGCAPPEDLYFLEAGLARPQIHVESLCVLGLLIGLALWFIVIWLLSPFDVTSICIAATGILVAVHEIAAPHFTATALPLFDGSTIRPRIETVSFFLTGAFCSLYLWALYPNDVYPVRVGTFVLTPLTSRFNLSGPGAHMSALFEGDGPSNQIRQLHTAILLAPVLVSLFFAGAAAAVPANSLPVLQDLFQSLVFPLALIVPVFLIHLIRMRRPFARTISALYGLILLTAGHDVLVDMNAIAGIPVFPVVFVGFLMGLGWVDLSHFRWRWQSALEGCKGTQIDLITQIEQLRSMHQSAESVARSQTKYVASISHELRSPLTSILGFTELLEDELDERLGPSQRSFIQSIREGSQRLLTLVNDLLDLSKTEAGALALRSASVDVDEVLDDAIRHVYPLAEAKKLALNIEKEYLGATVWADAMRLRQVITNLLSNAIKYTDQGRIVVRVLRAEMEEGASGRSAVAIEVEDTGRGITPEFMPHLFERFSREPNAPGLVSEGSGLGLAISKELVDAMGGRICVQSRPGKGSRFTILFPVEQSAS